MIVYRRKKKKQGRGLLNKVINKLPFELHIPGYQYCGPGTKLAKRLARGDPGINPLDAACKEHDIAYSQNRENIEARNLADRVLADKAWGRVRSDDAEFGEKAAAWVVTNAMKLKSRFGMGIKRKLSSRKKKRVTKKKKRASTALKRLFGMGIKKTRKKRATKKKKRVSTTLNSIIKAASKSVVPGRCAKTVISSALKNARAAIKKAGGKNRVKIPRILPVSSKIGGVLPLIPIFAGLSASGALASGAAGIMKAINEAKAAKHQLNESQRHNKTMEAIALGKGLYLKPYRKGYGLYLKPCRGKGLKKKPDVVLPDRALSNFDILEYAQKMKIPYFRGVFMRNTLPPSGPRYRESAIVNLDDASGPGTHWVAYRKRGDDVVYFDSFGDLQPPLDLLLYLGVEQVKYNPQRYQNFGTYNCGHLCLRFLGGEIKGI